MIDVILFYLTIFWSFRFGQILALNPTIKLWHLFAFYIVIKFFMMSYGYK
jgi:hypothetical protein